MFSPPIINILAHCLALIPGETTKSYNQVNRIDSLLIKKKKKKIPGAFELWGDPRRRKH